MCFETGHSGELLVAHGTNRIFRIVCTFMKCQVEFNIKCLGALVTSVRLVILLMLPHVTLKLGLFWKRQQTDFAFVEVWNRAVIINVLIIQRQNPIGVAARRAVPGLRGAAPRHRRGGPPLTRALPRRAPLCACAARQAAASPSSASRRHSRPAGPWPGLHCASEASRCSIPDLERRSGLPTLLVLTPNYSGDGRGRRVACLPCSRYVYALEGKVSQHVLLPRTPFQASLPRPSLERQKAWEGNLNAEMLLGTGRLE